MKRLIAVLFVICILFLAACGSAPAAGKSESAPAAPEVTAAEPEAAVTPEPAPSQAPAPSPEVEETSEPEPEEADGQNPVMNFVGPYVCGGCNVFVEAKGSKEGSVSITWSQSTTELAEWTMTGVLDTETLSINYKDGVKTMYVYGDDGLVTSTETVYTDGTGTIAFAEGGMLSWVDENEHVADGMLFAFMGGKMEQWNLS
ncbi:MAG: hypothetical protein IJJ22_01240 [Oscillospiraceae bacterium]|nr:hypothetical protein [Oscillospiraceae bacterium]